MGGILKLAFSDMGGRMCFWAFEDGIKTASLAIPPLLFCMELYSMAFVRCSCSVESMCISIVQYAEWYGSSR